jgi:predicted glycosyltransferase
MHDALANASLLVADTQTMVTEAALLGTPAIRSNSFVGDSDMGNFKDLEENKLIYNLSEFEDVLEKAIKIIRKPEIEAEWKVRRDKYLNNKVNLTNIITDIAMGAADGEKEVETIIQQHPELFN